jgi:hypothetical protein
MIAHLPVVGDRSTREELGIKREKKGVEGVDHFSEVNRDSPGLIEAVQITIENGIKKRLYQVMNDCTY